MSQSLQTFLADAWERHADHAHIVAQSLSQGLSLLDEDPSAAVEYARLAEHVLLGHCDQAGALLDLMHTLQGRAEGDAALAAVLQRARYAAQLSQSAGSGFDLSAGDLPVPEHLRALGQVCLALTRRPDMAGIQSLLQRAQALAESSDDMPAKRALAIITNNLAGDLRHERQAGRVSASQLASADALMLQAAQWARVYWEQGGGWLETERADWQLAHCLALAGQSAAAVAAAQACLQRCLDHGADDYEHCFAQEALAVAQLAAGQQALARQHAERMAEHVARLSDAGDLAYAQGVLSALQTRLAAA